MFTETYLEASQTSKMYAAINYFYTNAPSYVDVWLGSKYASGSLDEPYEMAPINSFILQYLFHN